MNSQEFDQTVRQSFGLRIGVSLAASLMLEAAFGGGLLAVVAGTLGIVAASGLVAKSLTFLTGDASP